MTTNLDIMDDQTIMTHVEELQQQLDNLKNGIREISHEINNPVGVVRMASYFLESTNPDNEKRAHYIKVINDSLDKIESCIRKLKVLRENPHTEIDKV